MTLVTVKINSDSNFSYTFSKKVTLKPQELEKAGVEMKSNGEVTLETEYEKIKEIDIEHWENVRGEFPAYRRLHNNLTDSIHFRSSTMGAAT